MSENHREPEVPEAEVPVVERLDGLARISSKELAPIHSMKSGTLRMLVLQVQEWLQIWGNDIARLTNSLAKENDDKSAVAMLKKIGTKAYDNLLSTVTKVTSDRGDPISSVIPVMS